MWVVNIRKRPSYIIDVVFTVLSGTGAPYPVADEYHLRMLGFWERFLVVSANALVKVKWDEVAG